MRIMAIVLPLTLILGACGDTGSEPGQGGGNRTIVGIVTDVEATSLTNVTSFSLRSEGSTYEIGIIPSIVYSFPPGHLRAHAIASEPVRVEVEDRGGNLIALTFEDA